VTSPSTGFRFTEQVRVTMPFDRLPLYGTGQDDNSFERLPLYGTGQDDRLTKKIVVQLKN